MAFSVYEVIRVSSLRVVGLFRSRGVLNQLRDRQDTRMTLLTLKAMQERNLCSHGKQTVNTVHIYHKITSVTQPDCVNSCDFTDHQESAEECQ